MKLLLDECLPVDLRHLVTGHDVFTVRYMGWSGIKNGALLALAASNGFDAVITTDRSIPHQQNPAQLPIAVIVLHSRSSNLADLSRLVPALLTTLSHFVPNAVSHVGAKP
jgi:hypothetical protein